MGQSLAKFGSEEKKEKEIGPIIENCYAKYFMETKDWTWGHFYHAICQTVEEINKTIGSTQFRVPKIGTIENAYQSSFFPKESLQALAQVKAYKLLPVIQKHHQGKGKSLTKEEFQKILQEVISDTGVTSIGAKDMLFYLFGVPATALLIKQRFAPKSIPNEAFIPVVTSATVFLLAKLNKI